MLFLMDCCVTVEGELNNDGLFDADISCSRRLRLVMVFIFATVLALRKYTESVWLPRKLLMKIKFARHRLFQNMVDNNRSGKLRNFSIRLSWVGLLDSLVILNRSDNLSIRLDDNQHRV